MLRPFLAAILFAGAVVISSWPLYMRLLAAMRGRRTLAALTMTLSLTLLVIMPLALVAYNLADDVGRFYEQLRIAVETGNAEPPLWLRRHADGGRVGRTPTRCELMHSREQMLELARACSSRRANTC